MKEGNPGVFLAGWRDGGVWKEMLSHCVPFCVYENATVSAHHKYAPWVRV